MGGVVNTVTRSGTNQYHGTGYFFFRNQDFNATDAFAGGINPDDWRLQSGASLGGPIVKDKLFFFLNGDFTRRNSPIVDSIVNANVNSDNSNIRSQRRHASQRLRSDRGNARTVRRYQFAPPALFRQCSADGRPGFALWQN